MEIKQKPALAQSLKVIHSVVNLKFISFISAGETFVQLMHPFLNAFILTLNTLYPTLV